MVSRLGNGVRRRQGPAGEQFAVVHSLALQQTLYEMGKAVLIITP
jgi:hypothetical protein